MSSLKWSDPAKLLRSQDKILWHVHIRFSDPVLSTKVILLSMQALASLTNDFFIIKWALKWAYGNSEKVLPWDLRGMPGCSISHYLWFWTLRCFGMDLLIFIGLTWTCREILHPRPLCFISCHSINDFCFLFCNFCDINTT